MSFMKFIRRQYNVPAKRGMHVKTNLGKGYITSAKPSGHLKVRLNGETKSRTFHPLTIEYLDIDIYKGDE